MALYKFYNSFIHPALWSLWFHCPESERLRQLSKTAV